MYIFRSLRTGMFLMTKFKLLANNYVSVAAGSGKLQQRQRVLQKPKNLKKKNFSIVDPIPHWFQCGSALVSMRFRIQGFLTKI